MSTWNHKGFEITLQGDKFSTSLPNKRVVVGSLAAAKKAIDKHLNAKAQEIAVNLPVVFLRSPRFPYDADGVIERGVITGISPETFAILGPIRDEKTKIEYVLPDSEENASLILEFVSTEKRYQSLREKIRDKAVPTSFAFYGRIKPLYADIVKKLQDGYDRALKA